MGPMELLLVIASCFNVCVSTCGCGIAWQVGIQKMGANKNRIKEMLEAKAAKDAQAARDGSSTSVHSEQEAHIGDLSHSRPYY